jgi:hypothetical protein
MREQKQKGNPWRYSDQIPTPTSVVIFVQQRFKSWLMLPRPWIRHRFGILYSIAENSRVRGEWSKDFTLIIAIPATPKNRIIDTDIWLGIIKNICILYSCSFYEILYLFYAGFIIVRFCIINYV